MLRGSEAEDLAPLTLEQLQGRKGNLMDLSEKVANLSTLGRRRREVVADIWEGSGAYLFIYFVFVNEWGSASLVAVQLV